LVIAVGYYFGGQNGALVALALSAIMNLVSYWFSDKIVLALYKAKEILREANPKFHLMVERSGKELCAVVCFRSWF